MLFFRCFLHVYISVYVNFPENKCVVPHGIPHIKMLDRVGLNYIHVQRSSSEKKSFCAMIVRTAKQIWLTSVNGEVFMNASSKIKRNIEDIVIICFIYSQLDTSRLNLRNEC